MFSLPIVLLLPSSLVETFFSGRGWCFNSEQMYKIKKKKNQKLEGINPKLFHFYFYIWAHCYFLWRRKTYLWKHLRCQLLHILVTRQKISAWWQRLKKIHAGYEDEHFRLAQVSVSCRVPDSSQGDSQEHHDRAAPWAQELSQRLSSVLNCSVCEKNDIPALEIQLLYLFVLLAVCKFPNPPCVCDSEAAILHNVLPWWVRSELPCQPYSSKRAGMEKRWLN